MLCRARRLSLLLLSRLPLLVLPLVFLPPQTMAAPQYSQSQCQQLNSERKAVQKKLRQPYKVEQGKALTARERELQRVLNRHCKKPKPNPPALPM